MPDITHFNWQEDNRCKKFTDWTEEVKHCEALGYTLVPHDWIIKKFRFKDDPNYTQLYIYRPARDEMDEFSMSNGRPAGDLGYPIYFKNEPKKARLFYWEEACDCWAPVPFEHEEIPGIINIDSFSEDGEEIELRLKRFDMTDQEMKDLPQD